MKIKMGKFTWIHKINPSHLTFKWCGNSVAFIVSIFWIGLPWFWFCDSSLREAKKRKKETKRSAQWFGNWYTHACVLRCSPEASYYLEWQVAYSLMNLLVIYSCSLLSFSKFYLYQYAQGCLLSKKIN